MPDTISLHPTEIGGPDFAFIAQDGSIHPSADMPPIEKGGHRPRWSHMPPAVKLCGSYLYELQPDHPRALRALGGRVAQHILVWEQAHAQPLPKGWMVHHLNGCKTDNRPENLEAMPRGQHHPTLYYQALQKRICALEEENKLLRAWVSFRAASNM